MNNLIWRSVTCRPGKKSVLPKGKADPCSCHRYRQTRPEGRSPPPRGCLRSGYALPSTPPQRHSHPVRRAVLTLIVAQQLVARQVLPLQFAQAFDQLAQPTPPHRLFLLAPGLAAGKDVGLLLLFDQLDPHVRSEGV